MDIIVQLFASVAETAGTSTVSLSLPDDSRITIKDIEAQLIKNYPQLGMILARSYFARNEEYCKRDTAILQGDVIAIIPPVSGGSETHFANDHDVAIVREVLDLQAMYDRVVDPKAGAVVVFSGTVREFTGNRQTSHLQYEAYETMAVNKLKEVMDECKAKWPIVKIAIWHRVGELAITEISVLIGVATAHRKDAFAAGEYAIKRLKQIVPIWKKEFFKDGDMEWVGPSEAWDPTKVE